MSRYESNKVSYDSPCDSDNDWTNSTGGSKYSDSESSVPEWDSDVGEDGELVFIKAKLANDPINTTQTPLLEGCETFKLRNNFKRTSTRRSAKDGRLRQLPQTSGLYEVVWCGPPKVLESCKT